MPFENTLLKGENLRNKHCFFFSHNTLSKINLIDFEECLSSANALYLDKYRILLYGKELQYLSLYT